MKKFVKMMVSMVAFGACGIYPNWTGEFNAGPVDPATFPPPYLGVGGVTNKAGTGSFTEIAAFSEDQKIGYYSFPFATTITASTSSKPPDALLIESNGAPVSAMPTINTYVFDAASPGSNPYPTTAKCDIPGGYVYDRVGQAFDARTQYPVFDGIPTATYVSTSGKAASWSYEPIASEISVSAISEPCQGYKSQATVSGGDINNTKPDHNYLAWPIIDPGAAVYRVGQTATTSNGITAQKYGWYNHYMVAYFNGGYIPTDSTPAADNTPQLHMIAKNLYYPRSQIIAKAGGKPAAGFIGQGYDIIDVPLGDPEYSPVCKVNTYDAGLDASGNAPTLNELPTNSGDVLTLYGTTVQAASPAYIYCLQIGANP